MQRTSDKIGKVAGVKVTLMRPPYGENNQRLDRVSRESWGWLRSSGTSTLFELEVLKHDRLVDYVLSNAGRDEVMMMHDIHESTIDEGLRPSSEACGSVAMPSKP